MADDGAADFLRLSKALKEAGRKDLRNELHKGLRTAAKPLIKKTRAATSRLPQKGGLAAKVKKTPQRIQVRTGVNTAGVRVVVPKKAGSGAQAANRGVIRHPVFGDRETWVDQPVPPGWFDEPIEASAPEIRPELEKAVQHVLDQIVHDARR